MSGTKPLLWPKVGPNKTIKTERPNHRSCRGICHWSQMLNTQKTTTKLGPLTRHMDTMRKMVDWFLCACKKCFIIGDSNLACISEFEVLDSQIDIFQSASFWHAEAILTKPMVTTKVKKVILSFGLNNRNQKSRNR